MNTASIFLACYWSAASPRVSAMVSRRRPAMVSRRLPAMTRYCIACVALVLVSVVPIATTSWTARADAGERAAIRRRTATPQLASELPGPFLRDQHNGRDGRKRLIPIALDQAPAEDPHFALELSVDGTRIEAGEPVKCGLTLKNRSDKRREFDAQAYTPFRVLRVTNDQGESDWFIGMTPQTAGGPEPLDAGKSTTLWEDVDATSLFLLDEGTYTLQVVMTDRERKVVQKSNSVSLTVKGGQLSAMKQFLKRLRQAAPEGWRVSSGFGAVYLVHAPTRLKKDVTSIQITFGVDSPENAGTITEKLKVTSLGESELGPGWLLAPDRANQLWPDHLAKVRSALKKS